MNYNETTIEEFSKLFYKKYPNTDINILDYSHKKDRKHYLLVENKYGKCIVSKTLLLKTGVISITKALNKTEYFINQLKEKFIDYEKYYKIIEYKSASAVIIENKHGVFIKPSNTLFSTFNFRINTSINNIHSFVKKFIEIHGNKYDYSLVEKIKNGRQIIKIICPIHGIFEKRVDKFINKQGCPKCSKEKVVNNVKLNPTGWSKTNWLKSAKNSKEYDSFKVYVLECWNNDEKFYKIGRTFRKIKYRFYGKSLPYNYKVLQLFEFQELTEENCNKCYDLENELKNTNKEYKYIPKIQFKGIEECFIKLNTFAHQILLN